MQIKALFVAYRNALLGSGGGSQVCTSEFIRSIRNAGIELELLPVEMDRRISTRLMRPFNRSKYFRPTRTNDLDTILRKAVEVDLVFLNQVGLAGIAEAIASTNAAPKIIALSHGCEITDLLHMARLAKELPISTKELWPHPRLALSRTLIDEARHRRYVDGCICISEPDVLTERWLGTPMVSSVPRSIHPKPISHEPVIGRFGYVGTLDHSPNLEGLVEILRELGKRQMPDVQVRIVGGPIRIGQWLEATFSNAEYLGPLSDIELLAEVSSWSAFLHPIFCMPRGCSTKLASALEWQLPIITTPEGRRGYQWRDGQLAETGSASGFVTAMLSLGTIQAISDARGAVGLVARSSPAEDQVSAQILQFVRKVLSA